MKWVKKVKRMFGNAEKVNNSQVIVRNGEIDFQITKINGKYYVKLIDFEPEIEVRKLSKLHDAVDILLHICLDV